MFPRVRSTDISTSDTLKNDFYPLSIDITKYFSSYIRRKKMEEGEIRKNGNRERLRDYRASFEHTLLRWLTNGTSTYSVAYVSRLFNIVRRRRTFRITEGICNLCSRLPLCSRDKREISGYVSIRGLLLPIMLRVCP